MPETGNGQPQAQKPAAAGLQAKFAQGMALHQQGKLADAERIYRDVLQQQPSHPGALHLLGVIAFQTRHAERAVELIRKAIALDANLAAAHSNLAAVLLDLKRPDEALASCDTAIALEPDLATAYNNRGHALLDLKRPEEAMASCDKAIALKPDYAEAYSNRGSVLEILKRPMEALASYDKAIALKPNFALAHNNRGNALRALGLLPEALASFEQATAREPDFALAHRNRGEVLEELKRYDEAFSAYDKAFTLESNLIGAEGCRLNIKMQLCDWNNFDSECAHLISSVRNGNANSPPFTFLAITTSPADQLQVSKLWVAKEYPHSLYTPVWRGERYDRDRIRVAYLSADFRDHPMSHLLVGVFEKHDRKRFKPTAISFQSEESSELTTRLKSSFDQFIDAKHLSDIDVARLLRSLEIDIAVDLMGYTLHARTGIMAYRSAPIQVTYLGYPGTMGADYIDYLIADATVIPDSSKPYYTEKIVHLPNSYYPTSYQVRDFNRSIKGRAVTRTDAELPNDAFIYCCFNGHFKIALSMFDCWMRILRKVEGGVLWLLEGSPRAASNLRKEAATRGINPERLVFAKRLSLPDHLARHGLADLFLDTLPYNAHTTASDALWAGLPVLTQMGETFAGRVAASLLKAVDLPELITATPQAYENLAIELANSPEKFAAIRQKLANNRLTTPLFDTKLITRHIEAGYTAMYERYQAGLPPDHIYVPQ